MNTEQTIQKQLADNPVILYMKGIPSQPECGFSQKAIGILNKINVPFAYVNVLQAPFIREKLPKISKWPTYPQLFVNGELVGGCDIMETMFNDGSLQALLTAAVPAKTAETETGLSASQVESYILKQLPQARVLVSGAGCDLEVIVITEQFSGLSLLKQQQAVLAGLSEPLADGRLHAVSVKTYTPQQWQAQQSTETTGLLQIKT